MRKKKDMLVATTKKYQLSLQRFASKLVSRSNFICAQSVLTGICRSTTKKMFVG